jgi:Dynamin family
MNDLDTTEQRAGALLEVYEATVRRELQSIGSNLLPELDSAAAILRSALSARREVRVGFLGESQVGKSSLINALIGRNALPTGGVGPLTAQATRLRYAASPSLEIRYHDRRRVNQFVFALRQYLFARGELSTMADAPPDEDGDGEALAAWSSAAAIDTEPGKVPERNVTGEYLIAQARLMLGVAENDLSRGAIHDAIRSVLGLAATGRIEAFEACRARIEIIKGLLGTTITSTSNDAGGMFMDALHLNVAGWCSPLVAELDLALDVELLSRVEVVDLPGVGVVGDPSGKVAEEFVQNDASALVIVARNNGLTEEVVGLLERTGVITRLLFGGDESRTTPIHIVFAITRLDDVAQDHWKRERATAKARNLPAPSREEVFLRLAGEMDRKTKEQVKRTLELSPQFEDLSSEMRERREHVVRQLCAAIEVICVSAKDFSNLQDEEDRGLAFLQDPQATNIPHFRERLVSLAERARESRRGRITRALESFRNLLDSHLAALAVGARDLTIAAAPDAQRFREELTKMIPTFQRRAVEQRKGVSTFLSEQIPPKLQELTDQAAKRALKHLNRLRLRGETLRWATLNAALVRNGTFDRRDIDYPGALTRSFVEVIAGTWETSIIDETRKVIRGLVGEQVDLVEEFLAEASQLSGGDELLGQVTAQKRVLKEQGKTAVQWTGEQLHDLSDDVQKRLTNVVGQPIERACRDAVRAGGNRGTGARGRILDAFQVGGQAAIIDARDSCLEILNDHFRKLRQSLGRLLRENEDPITLCYNAIVEEGAALADRVGRLERERRAEAIIRMRSALESPAAEQGWRPEPEPLRISVRPIVPSTASLVPLRGAAAGIFAFDAGAE